MFTRASVDCAERTVATTSSSGEEKWSAQRASGYAFARRRNTARERCRFSSNVSRGVRLRTPPPRGTRELALFARLSTGGSYSPLLHNFRGIDRSRWAVIYSRLRTPKKEIIIRYRFSSARLRWFAQSAVSLALVLALALAFALRSAPLAAAPARASAATLTVLHTSDLHGHVDPQDEVADRDYGEGLARIATAVRAARADGNPTLLLDSGDTIQGTPMQAIAFQ